jgi:hypothetical protein
MNCEDIIGAYLDSLRAKFIIKPADSGCLIYTPYLDPSNDPLSIFIEKIDDHFRISDMTQAFEYLFLHGMEIKPNSKQKWYLETTLNRLKVDLAINELYVDVGEEDIPHGILRLTEAIRSVESLILTAKIRKYTDFGEEVAGWLRENNIVFERKKEYIGVSGGAINVDFTIPRRGNPAFLYALHSESRNWATRLADRTIVNFMELHLAKLDFYPICVLDDIVDEDIWGSSYRLLKTHTKTVLFWDDKDKLKEVLAA